jgi:Transposase DDE domain
MLWNTSCMVRLSVIDRGRAVPLVWCVLEHGSATVAYDVYKTLLAKANTLMPFAGKVVLLADRGFADTELMGHLKRLGWHLRLRIKSNFWLYGPGHGGFQVRNSVLACGQAQFWHGVCVTTKRCGSVHLAVARPLASDEYWYVISDEPTDVQSLQEYGLRFDIEENFVDDKSNGFQLESSLIRSSEALERWCFVWAMTTLYLVALGTEVVQQGKRRLVDPHWFRGRSDLKIGWKWVSSALSRGYALISSVYLSSACDPEPAMASKKREQLRQYRFAFGPQEAA